MIDRSKLLDTIKNGAYWGAGVTFQRSNAVPLEKYSIFESLAKAQEYALANPVAYPGQIVAVVSEEGESTAYIIMGDGSLETIGEHPEIMTGASSEQNGTSGLVPSPTAGDDSKFLRGNGAWSIVNAEDVDLHGKPITEYLAVAITQKEYDELRANGQVVATTQYYIYEDEDK